MKKSVFIIAFILTSVLFLQPAFAQKPKSYCGQDMYNPLKLAGFANYPPFSWKYTFPVKSKLDVVRHTYKGFIFNAVEDVLKKEGKHYKETFNDDFNELKREAKHGKIDLFFTAYYEDEKKSGLDYIYPAYFGNIFVVVTLKEKALDVADFEQLGGLKGVVRNEEGIRRLIEPALRTDTKIEWVDGPRAAFEALLSGKVDFMISSPYAVYAEGRRFKIYDKLFVAKNPIRSVKLFTAFSKLSTCRHLKKGFAEDFNALMKDPVEKQKRLNAAIDEWVAQNADEPPLVVGGEALPQDQSGATEQADVVETQETVVQPVSPEAVSQEATTTPQPEAQEAVPTAPQTVQPAAAQ